MDSFFNLLLDPINIFCTLAMTLHSALTLPTNFLWSYLFILCCYTFYFFNANEFCDLHSFYYQLINDA